MVTLGSGANREVDDYILTVMPVILSLKMEISVKDRLLLRKVTLPVQTRKQELIEEKDLQGEADIFVSMENRISDFCITFWQVSVCVYRALIWHRNIFRIPCF